MSDSLFSPSWYRVAKLKPRLRKHTQIHRHDYRGEVWFILQDPVGGRSHRFSPAAYKFIGLMNGERSIDQLWEITNTTAGDDAPTQDEVIRLLGQLHAADSLICDVPPDSLELFRRYQKHERMQWKQRLWTPLAVRFPILDPERFLDRTYPYLSWLFGWPGAILWLLVVTTGTVLAIVHWGDLTENIVDRTMTPENLMVLWLVYPVLKALHELGHGYAIKKYGGEVHEIGIMLLVLVPVPYVDASAASGFRDKYQRMFVGAAGIMTELFFGAIALLVWLNVESGAVHAVAYNVMLISGVSTVLFNGNPLLRFDGYYVLADALEIPNLGTRANKYLGYLAQRYLFGSKDAESPAYLQGERVWFVIYGVAAFIYRIFIMFAIILYIGGKFFSIGVLLVIWALITMLVIPVAKKVSFVVTNPKLRLQRGRSVGVSALILTILIGIFFILPAPYWTRSHGVTWPSDASQVRVGSQGFVVQLLKPAGAMVSAGEALIEVTDPFLLARVRLLDAQRQELLSQLRAAQPNDRVQTAVIEDALAAIDASIKVAREQIDELTISSPKDGVFVVPRSDDLPDRFVRQGQLLGYVLAANDPVTVRVVVSQDEIGLVRTRTREVKVKPADWSHESYTAEVLRQTPSGTNQLPTAALGLAGGGKFAVDPRDPDGRETVQRVFELELGLPDDLPTEYIGRRVYVHFDHGYKPLGVQAYRALRQLFLRRFSV